MFSRDGDMDLPLVANLVSDTDLGAEAPAVMWVAGFPHKHFDGGEKTPAVLQSIWNSKHGTGSLTTQLLAASFSDQDRQLVSSVLR